jgi:hypothetical protein
MDAIIKNRPEVEKGLTTLKQYYTTMQLLSTTGDRLKITQQEFDELNKSLSKAGVTLNDVSKTPFAGKLILNMDDVKRKIDSGTGALEKMNTTKQPG